MDAVSPLLVDEGLATVDSEVDRLLAEHPPQDTDPRVFLGAQFDRGLAWVNQDLGFGGLGLPAGHQVLINERLADAGAPNPFVSNLVGVGQAAAAIQRYGTAEQRTRFLRPAWTCEERWCQMFSEPGAGSDLAGLATMAVRDGDEWRINGQKVWTSSATSARWAILIARTDPEAVKHNGLTFFVCDMHAPGIDIRPLRQADGNAHFNEVFLTDVLLPDSLRLGDVGQGWSISVASLSAERQAGGNARPPIDAVLELWRRREDKSSPEAQALRQRVVRAWSEVRVGELSEARRRAAQGAKGPGAEGSLGKLSRTIIAQLLGELSVDLLGPAGMLGGNYDHAQSNEDRSVLDEPTLYFLKTRSNSIMGGTTEVQKNIIGERLLGLAKDIRVDTTLPWNKVPRS